MGIDWLLLKPNSKEYINLPKKGEWCNDLWKIWDVLQDIESGETLVFMNDESKKYGEILDSPKWKEIELSDDLEWKAAFDAALRLKEKGESDKRVKNIAEECHIIPLFGYQMCDGSLHYRLSKSDAFVDFSIFDGELNAYSWVCPGEGRLFLKAIENHAITNNLKLIIPRVINTRLQNILVDNGYTMKSISYRDDTISVWSKG